MKTGVQLKKPFGTARMVEITHASYLSWEDAFSVEFEDSLSFLEPHRTIRQAAEISDRAIPIEVAVDDSRIGFRIRYDTGELAEISWAFIRELPPSLG